MSITPRQMICPRSKWSIKCPYSMKAEAITIHNTANDASAYNEIAYMNRNNNQVSFHFAVDNKEVVQGIPVDRNAWHAGDGGNGYGNRKTIAIEICYSLSGGARFDAAERLAAKFTAQLLKERGWGVDKVGTHQMRSGKYCPHRTLDYGWDRFKSMVQSELDQLNKPVVEWIDDTPANYIAVCDTALYNVVNGQLIKKYPAGTQLEFVQHAMVNGKGYYRTPYSRDHNVNNGLPINDFSEVVPPKKEKVVWKDIAPMKFMAKPDCTLLRLATQEVVETYQPGEVLEFVQETSFGGVKYYRTEYSKGKKVNNGVAADMLLPYEEPSKPEPDAPAEVDDPEPEDGYGETAAKTIWAQLFDLVVKFIKAITGRKEK